MFMSVCGGGLLTGMSYISLNNKVHTEHRIGQFVAIDLGTFSENQDAPGTRMI